MVESKTGGVQDYADHPFAGVAGEVVAAGPWEEVDEAFELEVFEASEDEVDVIIVDSEEVDAELLDVDVERVEGVDCVLEVLVATLEVGEVWLSEKLPNCEIVKSPGTKESVGQKASGYVVPSTTVPAAARALSYSELILAEALKGQAGTVVVEAVVVTSHPVVVRVDVSQLIELLSVAEPPMEVQVTYTSYPVVVPVQELVEEVKVEEVEGLDVVESVGELVGSSVGYEGSPSASIVMDGMLDENPRDDIMLVGGGGKIPGPVMPGMTIPKFEPPPPIGGQNQQFRTGMMGQP
ncbi:hypothetical protein Hte_002564 [Hypoxylon texense]